MKNLILAVFAVAALTVASWATIVTGNGATNSTLVSAPSVPGQRTYIKACTMANLATNTAKECVKVMDSTTVKFVMCADTGKVESFPPAGTGAGAQTVQGMHAGAMWAFFGEDMDFLNAVVLTGAADTTKVTVTCSYVTK